jgi:hypothetical protein
MCNKVPQLFYQTRRINTVFDNVKSIFDVIKPNFFFRIDMSFDIKDQELYRIINQLIQPISRYYTIDYKACSSELSRVQKRIKEMSVFKTLFKKDKEKK